jgi:hypothetical protein
MEKSWFRRGYYFALGEVRMYVAGGVLIVCDGGLGGQIEDDGMKQTPIHMSCCFIACRGNALLPRTNVTNALLLVDGDIDLSRASELKDSVIRASGEIRIPTRLKPENCTIEAHAKNATAPYKFFELADVGLSLADDEEGLVVRDVKPNTPFGNCGLAKGDLIRAIDDTPASHSEEFRKKVRRALVRQGDCLLTVTRGDKTHDLPVFFPLPK